MCEWLQKHNHAGVTSWASSVTQLERRALVHNGVRAALAANKRGVERSARSSARVREVRERTPTAIVHHDIACRTGKPAPEPVEQSLYLVVRWTELGPKRKSASRSRARTELRPRVGPHGPVPSRGKAAVAAVPGRVKGPHRPCRKRGRPLRSAAPRRRLHHRAGR